MQIPVLAHAAHHPPPHPSSLDREAPVAPLPSLFTFGADELVHVLAQRACLSGAALVFGSSALLVLLDIGLTVPLELCVLNLVTLQLVCWAPRGISRLPSAPKPSPLFWFFSLVVLATCRSIARQQDSQVLYVGQHQTGTTVFHSCQSIIHRLFTVRGPPASILPAVRLPHCLCWQSLNSTYRLP